MTNKIIVFISDHDEESKSVSVLLNGEESTLEFIDDFDNQEVNVCNMMLLCN